MVGKQAATLHMGGRQTHRQRAEQSTVLLCSRRHSESPQEADMGTASRGAWDSARPEWHSPMKLGPGEQAVPPPCVPGEDSEVQRTWEPVFGDPQLQSLCPTPQVSPGGRALCPKHRFLVSVQSCWKALGGSDRAALIGALRPGARHDSTAHPPWGLGEAIWPLWASISFACAMAHEHPYPAGLL